MLQNALPAFGLLLIMVVMAVVLKRMRHHLPRVTGQEGPAVRVLSSISLGPQQRVVTLKVGEGTDSICLVLGVAPGTVQTLHTLPLPPQPPATPGLPQSSGFAARLSQLTKAHHGTS